MGKFEHDTVVPYEQSTLRKKEQIAEMFNRIALRYDFLNRFLSIGTDLYWRKKAILELSDLKPEKLLDVATGTADMAILEAKYLRPRQIIGIDISEGMLNIGRKNC
jgi:demethylmenaquinone methyltransferase/2-methoxy-6-polyprenyl-1,4-benzoquinol methylase